MERRELTCISCPLGCAVTVVTEDGPAGAAVVEVTGNTCPRGEAYARGEVLHPVRTVTSTVPVMGGDIPMVSVKTKSPVPREKIAECMRQIHEAKVQAPVKPGDVILSDCAFTGIPIIATKFVDCK